MTFRLSALNFALGLALVSTTATGAELQLQGKVLNEQGQPVSNAKVHVHGRQQYVYTNAAGEFRLTVQSGAEIHIAAKGFNDQFVKAEQPQLQVALSKGSIEHLRVSAAGLHHYDLDMAQPASVLSGEALQRRQEPTIGETLKFTPGVHSNYYGPVAAAPVIRGLDGPRVKVLSNGLDSADVSRVGPDHAISADAITTEQIEVLRGPATLLYGSGAIGGVVNLVDNRIPRQMRSPQTVIDTKYNTVANERTAALAHDGSQGEFAWHFDGYDRQTDNFDTPTFTNDEGETLDQIENSQLDNQGLNLGGSWVTTDGLIGVSYGRINSQYGIPGHHHHGEEETESADEHTDEGVYADLTQNRYGLAAEWYSPVKGIETIALQSAYTDYQHAEVEGGVPGTRFENDSLENRLSIEHSDFLGWHGLVGLHQHQSDFAASGEEAFTPATDTHSNALFILEEKSFGDVQWQLGARLERVRHTPVNGEHDTSHDDEEHEELLLTKYSATASSLSSGLVWQFVPGYQWSLQLSHSARAPGASELFANGLHIATQGYELGLGYELTEDGDIHFHPDSVEKEVANNIDLGFAKTKGDLTFSYNFFLNEVDDFIYQANTGLTMAQLHAHEEHEGEAEDEHDHGDFTVYQYRQADARLYGVEFALNWRFAPAQQLEFFADSVRAELKSGGDLPRTPPMKAGVSYQYQGENWSGQFGLTHYAKQDKIAVDETVTAGYTLVDANVSYDFDLAALDLTAYLKATNLTDKLGFVHSSFVKEDVPLPGRSLALGLTARF
ncbi:TonB-dependent receptor [Rheinheimera texasensis]|uniref:TonB-dependent receptor n=1 Tax=Rheinheimera texasensis TaxID=306205 RepID=UPI0004E25874|nr:TonB-dependent receptor [Rheinheimera texasensis]